MREDLGRPRLNTAVLTSTAPAIHLAWLVRLRWAALLGQCLTMVIATAVFDLRLPVAPLALVIILEALLNATFHLWLRRGWRVTPGVVAVAMGLDLVILTGLLYLTGGPTNPFNFLYLVHIALAAMLLRPALSAALTVAATLFFALLFVDHVPLDLGADPHAHHAMAMGDAETPAMRLHTQGMWVAFVVAAAFIVFFTSRIRRELDRHAEALRQLQLRAERGERLGALATLAAGAAHELATPLSTIAVAARELELAAPSPDFAEEAGVIRREVDRCRDVLGRLGADAGRPRGERLVTTTVGALIRRVVDGLHVLVTLPPEVEGCLVEVQLNPLIRALRGLVDNALIASPSAVHITAAHAGGRVTLTIEDRGPGMSPAVLARVGEPFFTTRAGLAATAGQPASGMGLGVFLAHNTLADHGGTLRIESQEGVGTRAYAELPLARVAE